MADDSKPAGRPISPINSLIYTETLETGPLVKTKKALRMLPFIASLVIVAGQKLLAGGFWGVGQDSESPFTNIIVDSTVIDADGDTMTSGWSIVEDTCSSYNTSGCTDVNILNTNLLRAYDRRNLGTARNTYYRGVLSMIATIGVSQITYYLKRIPPILIYALLASVLISSVSATAFEQCIADVQTGMYGTTGGTDNNGNPVANISTATAITYELCLQACGSGPEPFQWSTFSQQFGAWLLPWLALVSQLPFGAKYRQDNLMSVLLAIGSPTLAAYSLAMTVLNGQWLAKRFSGVRYPNSQRAVRILSSLQQVPLKVSTTGGLLASLVVLHENDIWWKDFDERLDYTHTWSIAAATSIAWVIIAYLLTVISAFSNITSNLNSSGQGVGSAWLWLLPIVIGWLNVSPKCDYDRLGVAVDRANAIAYVATPVGGSREAEAFSARRGLLLQQPNGVSTFRVLECSPPIFNYARFLPWIQAAEDVYSAFHAASIKAEKHEPVDPTSEWVRGPSSGGVDVANRRGTTEQVIAYCASSSDARRNRWGPGVFSRFFTASVLGLGLQWGTAGAAILVEWYTPTRGLGCRSGAYLLHAIFSTVVWMLLVASSVLGHYSSHMQSSDYIAGLSVGLRRLGNVLATCNATWIIVVCMFQFGNFFDRCYCNSSVLGLKSKAFVVVTLIPADIGIMRGAWIGGVALALGCAAAFVVFVRIIFIPPTQSSEP